ncbi:NUDIX hydrolase domain-like protein [Endogone sp. FLAS-F59071]|nr:NUDIX hydrolase domain-like protein [Endogone sp. FLAS-F59071]|eukprot:RUS19473.1 NUDIX hydrolase domain-like protein [Endogone sp. FLAS-F59071]
MSFQTLLQVVEKCDNFPHALPSYLNPPKSDSHDDEPLNTHVLRVGSAIVGRLLPSTVTAIQEYNARQTGDPPFVIGDGCVTFDEHIHTPEERSRIIEGLLRTWVEEKRFVALKGWRNELLSAYGDMTQPDNIAFVFERAGAAVLGIPSYGVHLNAYIRDENGDLNMWIARRSPTKQTWPGMLDNCVAGGIAHGLAVYETVVKECEEEASIPAEIARKARNVGAISYFLVTPNGLQPETQYIFDIELPKEVIPKPSDGEVEAFYLWDMTEVT